jgi:cytochrome c-type biogenesis protein
MEGVFLGGSIAAAFLAGAIALFAPCCITVLFPSYLAAAVRNARWRLVPLTLIFATGVATVLVPVTLGVGLLTRSLLRYHGPVYLAGAVLMVVLAVVATTGRTWSLPILRRSPDVSRTDSGGVYALGVFSGAASACCAPVLAGVLTLTAVAPSTATGIGIGLAYVAGMVSPLLVMTLLWDRTGLRDRFQPTSRPVAWSLAGHRFTTTTFNLAMAAVFTIMAAVLTVVAATGATLAPETQGRIGRWLTDLATPLADAVAGVPNWVTALVLLAGAAAAIRWSGRTRPTPSSTSGPDLDLATETDEHATPACH